MSECRKHQAPSHKCSKQMEGKGDQTEVLPSWAKAKRKQNSSTKSHRHLSCKVEARNPFIQWIPILARKTAQYRWHYSTVSFSKEADEKAACAHSLWVWPRPRTSWMPWNELAPDTSNENETDAAIGYVLFKLQPAVIKCASTASRTAVPVARKNGVSCNEHNRSLCFQTKDTSKGA